jgi:hypothetical protein
MTALTLHQSPRETVRLEFFRTISLILLSGHSISLMKCFFHDGSVLEIGRAMGLSRQQARRALNIHTLFAARFGTKDLEEWDKSANVTLNPSTLKTFLKEPAATRLASKILGVSEARILAKLTKY